MRVLLPTALPEPQRRQAYEQLIWATFCDREVFSGDAPVVVRWEDTAGVDGGRLKLSLLGRGRQVVAQVVVPATPSGQTPSLSIAPRWPMASTGWWSNRTKTCRCAMSSRCRC